MSFKVMTDSSANLPGSLLKKYDIIVTPFSFYIDGKAETCTDIEIFDGSAFYKKIKKGALVTTSQVTPATYCDYFEPFLAAGQDIIFVGIASGISGAFSSANIAAAELEEKYPGRKICCIDSMTASLGQGIPAIQAARFRNAGKTFEETCKYISELVERTHSIFTVDDLMCLKRGGRLSNIAAVAGILLQIKPILKGDETAHIVSIDKIRGRRKAIEALASRYAKLVVNASEQTVGIAHADSPEDAAYLEELIRKAAPPKEIISVCYEPVTGAHVGPGAVALFFESFPGVKLEN